MGQASLREASLEFGALRRDEQRETRREQRDRENAEAIGGMRNPKGSVDQLPGLGGFGRWFSEFLDEFIVKRPELRTCVETTRRGEPVPFPQEMVREAQLELAEALGTELQESTGSPLCSSLLRALADWTDDPDASLLADWVDTGAPIGIRHPIPSTGVFPQVDPEQPPTPVSELFTSPGEELSHKSAEQDLATSLELLKEAEAKGFAKIFESRVELEEYLNTTELVFNPLGLISKIKPDGTWKHRLIWD